MKHKRKRIFRTELTSTSFYKKYLELGYTITEAKAKVRELNRKITMKTDLFQLEKEKAEQ